MQLVWCQPKKTEIILSRVINLTIKLTQFYSIINKNLEKLCVWWILTFIKTVVSLGTGRLYLSFRSLPVTSYAWLLPLELTFLTQRWTTWSPARISSRSWEATSPVWPWHCGYPRDRYSHEWSALCIRRKYPDLV